jgi:hypothetical protein
MKKWLPIVVAVVFLAGFGMAYGGGDCGSHGSKSCTGKCWKVCPMKCDRADWGYAYQSADFYPDAAPRELKYFHSVLLPIREARKSGETAYVRENAGHLYNAAKEVKGSRPCVDKMQQKHYATAAKELVRDSKRLKEMVHGGSNDAVMEQVTRIEEDFVRLANLAECH